MPAGNILKQSLH